MSLAEIQSAIEALPVGQRAALLDWLCELERAASGMQGFGAAYCPEDEVYERLMDDAGR
jgi:hypothetical protein